MTKLEIWNAALALIPHDIRIADVDEDSTEAQRCREQWDGARRSVLSAREWHFLVRDSHECPGGWGATGGGFSRPDDALRVCGLVSPDGRRIPARSRNGLFYPAAPHCFAVALQYIPDSGAPEDWPDFVADAVVAELAARVAPVLAGNPQRSAELKQTAMARLEAAALANAEETAHDGGDPYFFVHARE